MLFIDSLISTATIHTFFHFFKKYFLVQQIHFQSIITITTLFLLKYVASDIQNSPTNIHDTKTFFVIKHHAPNVLAGNYVKPFLNFYGILNYKLPDLELNHMTVVNLMLNF